jgi:hypothetical protein
MRRVTERFAAVLCALASIIIPSDGLTQELPSTKMFDGVELRLNGTTLAARPLAIQEIKRAGIAEARPGLWVGERVAVLSAAKNMGALGMSFEGIFSSNDQAKRQIVRLSAEVEHVFEPKEAVKEFNLQLKEIEIQCALSSAAQATTCKKEKGYAGIVAIRDKLIAAEGPCDIAAKAYYAATNDCFDYGCQAPSDKSAFKAFDDNCMNALQPWRHPDGIVRADPAPRVFETGGAEDGAEGALRAVVLLELIKGGQRQHLCGGLLLSGNRIVTARHCFETQYLQDMLRKGMIEVRFLKGADQTYALQWSDDILAGGSGVAGDRVVLSFSAPNVFAAPRIEFVEPSVPADAVILGYFRDHDTERAKDDPNAVGGVPSQSVSWRGLRWARAGMCFAVNAKPGCIRALCQTIPGYSGAPIIDTATASSDQPLKVYGLVSGPDAGQLGCGDRQPLTTLASSGVGIQP